MLCEGLGPSNRAGHGAFALCLYEVPVPYVAVASTAVTFTRALVILTNTKRVRRQGYTRREWCAETGNSAWRIYPTPETRAPQNHHPLRRRVRFQELPVAAFFGQIQFTLREKRKVSVLYGQSVGGTWCLGKTHLRELVLGVTRHGGESS